MWPVCLLNYVQQAQGNKPNMALSQQVWSGLHSNTPISHLSLHACSFARGRRTMLQYYCSLLLVHAYGQFSFETPDLLHSDTYSSCSRPGEAWCIIWRERNNRVFNSSAGRLDHGGRVVLEGRRVQASAARTRVACVSQG
jgi:hypothetical protein